MRTNDQTHTHTHTHTHRANKCVYQPPLCSCRSRSSITHTHTHTENTHTDARRSVVCARRNRLKIVDTHCVQLSPWVTTTHSSQRHTSFKHGSEKSLLVYLWEWILYYYFINIVNITILCLNFFFKITWCHLKGFLLNLLIVPLRTSPLQTSNMSEVLTKM